MKAAIQKSFDYISGCLDTPKKTLWLTIVVMAVAAFLVIDLPFGDEGTHGSQSNLAQPDSLVMAGQLVYQEEGCQYCHSQALRPFVWEISRFADASKYGQFPLVSGLESRFQSPALRGSQRIGPDLSRTASKYTEESLTAYLKSRGGNTYGADIHRYSHLFISDSRIFALPLSWRVRMMMNSRIPFSDPYQKSVFERTADRTKGEALVAYLLSLGKNQMIFAGRYFANQ